MIDTKQLIDEAVNILREDLTYTLWDEYGIKVPDSENYVDMAVDSLVDEVWFEGNHLYQLDELGDISRTSFASWCEGFEVKDYFDAGSNPNDNVEYYDYYYDYEDCGMIENVRRALSTMIRVQPMRIIREGLEEKFGIDVLNNDTIIE